MKNKDITLVVIVSIVSIVFALLISSALFTSGSNRKKTAEVVDKITADFNEPDKRYFNEQSFNPTRNITIQNNQNNQPFRIQ